MRARFAFTVLLTACLPYVSYAHFTDTLLRVSPSVNTVFKSTDCNSSITISNGGLTLTDTTNTNIACRASVAHYAGKFYYETTLAGTPTNEQGVGVANNGPSNPINGGFTLSGAFIFGGDKNSAVFLFGNYGGPDFFWDNHSTTGIAQPASGKTIQVAVDLDTDPPQIWVSPDATNSGGTGSCAGGPIWNGSSTSCPTQPGSGTPVTGYTGKQMFLPGYGYFPVWSFGFVNTTATVPTFNFGASAFVGTVPTGYHAWNVGAGSAPTHPGPLSPMNINIANAPGWQQSTAYVAGDRVVAGPGWTAGSPGSYTSGSALYLWAVTSSGGGTSASAGNGPQSCASPAGVGGIPTATWAGATTVTDGGVTWACLTQVDYVTLSGAFYDSSVNWATSQNYFGGQWVLNGGNAYRMGASEGTTPFTCTSASSGGGPTGTGSGITDNTCSWDYQGPITYSSQLNRWPHEVFDNGTAAQPEMLYSYDVNMTMWYGGAARPVYQPGQNGETDPILMWWHNEVTISDVTTVCHDAYVTEYGSTISTVNSGPDQFNCQGLMTWYPFTLTVAAGDSFVDNITPASGPLRFDNTKGVSLYTTTTWVSGSGGHGDTLAFSDNGGVVKRLQFQSVNGPVVDAHGGGPGQGHLNYMIFTQDLMDAGGGYGVLACDGACNINNDVLIYRGTTTGGFAVNMGYPGPLQNLTIIGPSAGSCATCSAIETNGLSASIYSSAGSYFPPPWNNIAIFGFANPYAYVNGNAWPSHTAANNATDIASSYSGTSSAFTLAMDGGVYTTVQVPGVGSTCNPSGTSTCYSLVASSQFVNSTVGSSLDLRDLSTGGIYNGGAGITPFGCNGCSLGAVSTGADILGTTRPVGGRYDIGAFEH